ncbi:MAG: OprO/OprP family phosphate-selective porin [Lysobacteraceae bacterium]
MKLLPSLLAAAVLAALSPSARADITIDQFDFFGGSEVTLEGLIQTDFDKYNRDVANLNASVKDGTDSDSEFRRAEFTLKGKGTKFDWAVGYDPKAKKFLDTNVKFKLGAYTSITAGQFKQPNSMEELSSTKNNDFVAKSMITNTFGVSRRLGVAFATGADNWTFTGSAFGDELTRGLAHGNGFGARGTWAPIKNGDNTLHFGLSYVDYQAEDPLGDGRTRIRAKPDADLSGARLIDTGQFTDGERIRTAGVEGLWLHGPFKLQGEYMSSRTGRKLHQDFTGDGWYVQGVWNITGEKFGYKSGGPTTPLPDEPASGMWQLGVRYDSMDLNDGRLLAGVPFPVVDGVLGGKEHNLTVGVNYYWHSNFKLMLNYVKVNSERYNTALHAFVKDDPSIIEARAQFYF